MCLNPVAKSNSKGSGSSKLGMAERVGFEVASAENAHAPTEGASPLVGSPRGELFPAAPLFESHPLYFLACGSFSV